MLAKCPSCNQYSFRGYKGVYCKEKPYYKIFQCTNSICKKSYIIEKKMGSRKPAEELTRRRDIDYYLKERVGCPLCIKFKENIKYRGSVRNPLDTTSSDYEYKYVVYIGGSHNKLNQFYCNNHSTSPFRQKFQFVQNIYELKMMSLGKYIKEGSSQYFYNKVNEVYKKGKGKYPFKEDPKNIFLTLYYLGIPQTALAKIFHTSQPTISRLIKDKNLEEPKETLYIEKNHTSLFYTQIKISEKTLLDMKIRWKIITLNP